MAVRKPYIWNVVEPVKTAEARDDDRHATDAESRPPDAPVEGVPALVDAPAPVPEHNDDPARQRVFRGHGRPGMIRRVLRWVFAKRELTPDELAMQRQNQEYQAQAKLLHGEAMELKRRIVARLTELGFARKILQDGREVVLSRVRFTNVWSTPDAHFLEFDPHLPSGVYIAQIVDETVLAELSISCRLRVHGKYSPETGAYLMVERASGIMGIPNHVKLSDMLELFPESAGPMVVPLGMTLNRKPIFRDVAAMPHILISGTTGGGKSNQLNILMLTLLSRNKPADLRVLMIDLKGGMEFSHYKNIPHLITLDVDIQPEDKHAEPETVHIDGIITESRQVPPALTWVVDEAQRRMRIISAAGYSDVVDYNARHYKSKFPRLLVVFDELASIRLLDPKAGKRADALMTALGNLGRAVGIHLVVCSQFPDKQILSTQIKAVLGAKMAFGCSTAAASMVILGNWDAKGLSPAGRFVYQSGAEQLLVQGPYFPVESRHRLLDEIRAGRSGLTMPSNAKHDVTPSEIMEWALANANGYLNRDRLFKQFEQRGLSNIELSGWLKSWEGQRYRIGEAWYEVHKPSNPTSSRLLRPVDASPESDNPV